MNIDVTDFYPRSPCGERQQHHQNRLSPNRNFYPRSPCGERRNSKINRLMIGYFYPRSPCGERRHSLNLPSSPIDISIHALLAESDVGVAQGADTGDISIHALLAESDLLII